MRLAQYASCTRRSGSVSFIAGANVLRQSRSIALWWAANEATRSAAASGVPSGTGLDGMTKSSVREPRGPSETPYSTSPNAVEGSGAPVTSRGCSSIETPARGAANVAITWPSRRIARSPNA